MMQANLAATKSQLDAERAQNQERKVKVRAYLDTLSKENKQLQETHAAMEASMKDALAARNYVEQHRNQLESALHTAKDQVSIVFLLVNLCFTQSSNRIVLRSL